MRNRLCWAFGLLTVAIANAAHGQGADTGLVYSQGVHAYFAGRSAQADGFLTQALAIDAQDPRAYYFRGLARLRLGRRDEARADMQHGAALEAQQPNRFAIGAALERVQGPDRLLLEQFRNAGRLAAASRRSEVQLRRYGQVSHSEPADPYRRATIPLDQLMQSGGSAPVVVWERSPQPQPAWAGIVSRPPTGAASAGGSDDPFPDDPLGAGPAAGPARPATAPAISPAAPAPVTTPAPANADENPFGEPFTTGPARIPPQPAGGARPREITPPVEEDPFRGQ